MVEGEGKSHHLAHADLTFKNARLFHHATNAEDACLRRVENGGEAVHAKHAHIGNGKGAAGNFVHGKTALAGAAGSVAHLGLEFFKAVGVRILDVGNNEARIERNGDAKVHMFVHVDAVCLQGGVHDGVLPECAAHGKSDDVVEREAVFRVFFVAGQHGIAQGNHFGNVGFHKNGQLRRVLQAGLHVVRYKLAQAVHGDDFVRISIRGGAWLRRGYAGRSRGFCGGFVGGANILFRNNAIASCARYRCQINAQLFGDLAGRRHGANLSLRRAGLCCRSLDFGPGRCRSGRAGHRISALRGRCGHSFARFADDADNLHDRNNLALRADNLQKHAACRRLDHVGDLVCFHFQQGLPHCHRTAFGHKPARNLACFHGEAPFGHLHFVGHPLPPCADVAHAFMPT